VTSVLAKWIGIPKHFLRPRERTPWSLPAPSAPATPCAQRRAGAPPQRPGGAQRCMALADAGQAWSASLYGMNANGFMRPINSITTSTRCATFNRQLAHQIVMALSLQTHDDGNTALYASLHLYLKILSQLPWSRLHDQRVWGQILADAKDRLSLISSNIASIQQKTAMINSSRGITSSGCEVSFTHKRRYINGLCPVKPS
jgi:hypothetical protein